MNGLTSKEVLERQEQGLVNTNENKITKTTEQIIRDNVFTLFNGFNFAIGVCLALVHAWKQMLFLMIILANTVIGIVQELRARKMVEHLTLISAMKAKVVRDGKESKIIVDELVKDDICILEAGDQICADSVLAKGEVEVNEALLTGESDLVLKKEGDKLLSGSFVVSGKCYAKVTHVGAENFASKIVSQAKEYKKTKSELLGAIRKLTKFTGYFVGPIGIILFVQSYFMGGEALDESVVSAAAAVLGLLPKGLVLLITFALVVSLIQLSKRKILVQGLHSIETLAYVDMLCLDKTGTITEGKMCVNAVHPVDDIVMPVSFEEAMRCYIGAAEDNNATFLAMKEHFGTDNSLKVTAKSPFASERKWGSVTFEGVGTVFVGACERLIGDDNHGSLEIENAQKSGNRILCVAYSKSGDITDVTPIAAIEFCDPIRKDAKETLEFFRKEGVQVKIISGDSPVTVSNIARQAGMNDYESFIDLSKNDEAIEDIAGKYSIFGRVTPNQKKELVRALKNKGHTVAMTGDGVNDVLALKESDCSIAMAAGSDAAKQVSQLVLLKSDFSSLPEVVMEGRRVINNITRFGSIFIIKTIFSFILALAGVLFAMSYPFQPIQITLYDGAIEGWFSFIMAFERNYARVHGYFLANVIRQAMPFALAIALSIFALKAVSSMLGLSEEQANTIMFYILGTIGIFAVLKACLPFTRLRIFVCSTMVVGFYSAAVLFSSLLLELEKMNLYMLTITATSVALLVPLLFVFNYITVKLFNRFQKP